MVKDRLGSRLGPGESTNLLNVWRESGEVRVRPGMTAFRNRITTLPVQNLFTAELADGTKSVLRLDEDNPYFDNGTAWASISPGSPFWTGNSTTPFGIAQVLNEVIVSNGVAADGVKRWTGSGNFATVPNAGILIDHDAFRYIASFASRVIGAYTSGTNGAVTVVGSAIGSTTDWTIDNGAFAASRVEHPSHITGLTSDDNILLVWKERAIIAGVETGDSDTPINWTLLKTEGIGATAPRSISSWGGFSTALSYEGFFLLQNQSPQFIDTDIKRDFFSRLNPTALRQVHSLVMPEYGKIIWFVPEGADPYPRHAWVYDLLFQSWDRWELGVPITSAVRTFAGTGAVIDAYGGEGGIADITGNNAIIDTGVIANVYIDAVGTEASSVIYLLGDSIGNTYTLDFAATNDAAAPFVMTWESPDVRWEGLADPETGAVIGPRQLVTLDCVGIEYNYSGAATTLVCSVSVDGGLTWATLESKSISSTSAMYTRLDFWGRATGHRVRVRLQIDNVVGQPRFRDMTLYGYPAGEIR
jgi:hypothetical protein